MSIQFQIDREGHRPLYQQIIDGLQAQIRDGKLPEGTKLPTVRALAEELGVTRLTVHNAYRQLKRDGWIESTVGRGTFVRASPQPKTLASIAHDEISPDQMIRQVWDVETSVGVRNFAYAHPDSSHFPLDDFWRSLATLRSTPSKLFQYACTQGEPELRIELTQLAEARGIGVTADDLIVTGGVTQGLSLATRTLTEPGDLIAVEQPTYLGALQIAEAQDLRTAGVPMDDEGPRLDVLERLIAQRRPRLFYTVPSFHNPTGRNASPARRRELLDLAERHQLLIVEDDVYGRLSYDNEPPPPLKRDDPGELIVYLDGFSKTLMPGLRVGYAIAPTLIREQLLKAKRADDLCGPSMTQHALAEFLRQGHYDAHLKRILPVYEARRDALLRALRREMPDDVRWTEPDGGLCCWVTVPGRPHIQGLYRKALDRGLVFTPGNVFLADPDADGHLRLCFGQSDETVIREGVALLGELLRTWLAETESRAVTDRSPTPLV